MGCTASSFRVPCSSSVLLGVAWGALALLQAGEAQAWCRTTTETPLTGSECVEDGLPLQWQRQCISFTIEKPGKFGPALEDVRDAADASFAAWSDIECDGHRIGLSLAQTEELAICPEAEHDRHGPNMNAVLFVEDWSDHEDLPRDAFAVTLVWNLVKTGEIVDADMLLNPTLGDLTICGSNCPRAPVVVDFQNVVTHEAGHFLGLAHTDVFEATMSATAPVGETKKRSLEPDDIAGLCAIYGDLPDPQCTREDFIPERGFTPVCAMPHETDGCGTASVMRAQPAASWLPAGLLAACAALWLRRRRRG